MNQVQRKFLIEKIESKVKLEIASLKESIPDAPNINNYLFHEAMSGRLKVKSSDSIEKTVIEKALQSKQDDNWLTGERNALSNKTKVSFNIEEIFEIPESFNKIKEEYEKKKEEIQTKISAISMQSETLITRIQLASNSTLEKMIREVDDMGDISLMDTKLKLIQ